MQTISNLLGQSVNSMSELIVLFDPDASRYTIQIKERAFTGSGSIALIECSRDEFGTFVATLAGHLTRSHIDTNDAQASHDEVQFEQANRATKKSI